MLKFGWGNLSSTCWAQGTVVRQTLYVVEAGVDLHKGREYFESLLACKTKNQSEKERISYGNDQMERDDTRRDKELERL
jgi:hypothetical protein